MSGRRSGEPSAATGSSIRTRPSCTSPWRRMPTCRGCGPRYSRPPASVPGFNTSVGDAQSAALSGVLAPSRQSVTVRVYGENLETLGALAHRIAGRMRAVGDLGRPSIQRQTAEPNIEVRVNDAAAVRAGVLPGDARRQASTLVEGLTVGNFFQDQAVFDVTVFGEPAIHRTRRRCGQASDRHLRRRSRPPRPDRLRRSARRPVRHPARGAVALCRCHRATAQRGPRRCPCPGRPADHACRDAAGLPRRGSRQHPGGRRPRTPRSCPTCWPLRSASLLLLQAALGSWRLAAMVFLALPVTIAGGLLLAAITGNLDSLAADAGLLGALAFSVRLGLPLMSYIRRAQLGGGAEARVRGGDRRVLRSLRGRFRRRGGARRCADPVRHPRQRRPATSSATSPRS